MGSAQLIKAIAAVGIVSVGAVGCALERELVQAQDQMPAAASQSARSRAAADAEALVRFGPRVTGTPAILKASAYLQTAYRQAGYATKVQTFTYPKFEDLGSTLAVNGKAIKGQALNGSVAGRPAAQLVVVPGVGRPADFAAANVKGAIALVRRGEIRFLEKARNAAAAGAVGIVIVNTQPGDLTGASLGGTASIPVLALSGRQGSPLLGQPAQQATLNVNTRQRRVTGRNIIAHLPSVTRPSVVLGGHYDAVAGSPGANDNASGTAVVLAIARSAANTPLARQAWFIAFDGEEDGLHGSRAFVRTADPQLLQGLKGMLNFDMVGVNPKLLVGGTRSLTAHARTAAPSVSVFGGRGGSDHAPFAAAGVPVLFFHRGQEPNYHTPNDKQVNPGQLDETAQVGLDVARQLLSDSSSGAAPSRTR